MDFKKTFEGGEPKVQWSDIMLMQYSNYYAIQAQAKGIDTQNTGVILEGCVVTPDWDGITGEATADISDGYMIIKGELVKVEGTLTSNASAPEFAPSNIRYAHLFAKPLIQFNATGDKTFNDGTPRETWQETRLELVMKNNTSPDSDEVYIASIQVDINSPYSYSLYEMKIWDMDETLIRANSATSTEMVSRDNITNKIVTPESIHQSFGNFSIREILSTDRLDLTVPDGARWIFILPEGTTSCTVLSAFAFGNGVGPIASNLRVGNTSYKNWTGATVDEDEYLTWTYDTLTRTLYVYWQINPDYLTTSAYAQVLVTES